LRDREQGEPLVSNKSLVVAPEENWARVRDATKHTSDPPPALSGVSQPLQMPLPETVPPNETANLELTTELRKN